MTAPRGQTLLAVTFAPDGDNPDVIAGMVAAATGVLTQCERTGLSPDGLLNVSAGPAGELLGLYEEIRAGIGEPAHPAVTAVADQMLARLKAEPERFAALAFVHASPAQQLEVPPPPKLWTPE